MSNCYFPDYDINSMYYHTIIPCVFPKKKRKSNKNKNFMNYKDWETPRNVSKAVAGATVIPQFGTMPLDRTVMLDDNNDLPNALLWIHDMGYKMQTRNQVVDGERIREAIVFKKQKDAALFKIIWG